MSSRAVRWLAVWALVASSATSIQSAENRTCEPRAGEIISAQGEVEYRNGGAWEAIAIGQQLCDQEAVRTGRNSRAAIQLVDDAVLRLDENTTLVLSDVAPEPEEPSFLQLVLGAIQSFSRDPQTVQVDTPYINATIEGTEFALRVTPEASELAVLEGVVLAANDLGSVRVASGEGAVASAGMAPQSVTLVRPRDAVSWGLYYPPTISLAAAEASGVPALAEAARLARENRPDAAIARLEAIPDASTDVRIYHAGLLLSVGRVDEAAALLDALLAADPDNGVALAQSAVIDIARNEEEAALAKAQQAVAAAPDAAAPYISLSYAQQAQFRLEDARDTLLAASDQVPDSPLVWGRLSEIWLSLGYRDRSGEAAERAISLDPQLERAHTMQGFAALTRYQTGPAAEAFERAIQLDPADPMPRLGLGLAKIREGDLEAGRAEIDAAVALDSNRSLLRSYLGKAYFEENRSDLSAEQLAIAKELDPQDPTPYLYEAIRLQTENRPGEALEQIQQSIERNENRAVYRSRLQLDQDQAARAASLGRIYEDLGFIKLGMREATRSQALDPANAAAHRFLADIYRNERRRELARVSELTRAQLLQDVNLNPIQPSLTETNLNLVSAGGPENAGFNEFNSLFASDGFRFTATGQIGNDDSLGGEAAIALQDDNVSVSFGGFEFSSDGFRDNFDVEHRIYDLFAQWDVTPEFSLQFEGRHRHTENGDLTLNFDPDVFDPSFEDQFTENSARLGIRYSPDPHNTTLFSGVFSDREAFRSFIFPPLAPFIFLNTELEGQAWQAEIQHIYQQDFFNLTFGASYAKSDQDLFSFFTAPGFGLPPFPLDFPFTKPFNHEAFRIYGYGNVELPYDVTLTAGVSYDNVETAAAQGTPGKHDIEEVSPKAGIEWRPIDGLTLRGAYAQVVKPPLATNRTIEPTQVAGFNQYFDDVNGTVSERYGFGADWQITSDISIGAEFTWRDLEVPIGDGTQTLVTKWDEKTFGAYLYALPHERVPVSVEVIYDKFDAASSAFTTDPLTIVPLEVETISVPVTARYFDPSGFFAGVRGTYVDQEVKRAAGVLLPDGHSDFFLLDAHVGYRFPNRRGSISLAAQNLLDEDFRYQDDSFREFGDDPSTGPYFPGISVMGRLTINF